MTAVRLRRGVEHLQPSKSAPISALRPEIWKTGQARIRSDKSKKEWECGRGLSFRLQLEVRSENSRDWDKPGGGYSADRTGWLDPSEFIDSRSRPGTP